MIAWDAIENAVRAWVLPASGLASNRVYFADQDVPATEAAPRVTIRIGGPVHLGIDAIEQSFDPGQPAGQEILQTARGFRTITVDLQSFAPTMVGAGDTALAVMAKIQAALSLPSVRYALNAAGLGVLQEGSIQRIPQVRQTINEDRATLSVRFCVTQSISERLGYIESVEVRYGQGPVFEQRGVEAPGFTLEQVRPINSPFPRQEADGAIRFSREAAVAGGALGTQAVNVSALVQRELERWPAKHLSEATTLSLWFRREANIPVAGVATPSDRLCFLYAGQSRNPAPPAYLFLLWGLTYRPLSSELRFTTETPISAVSSGVTARTTVLAGELPIGIWKHIVVTNERNGSVSGETFGSTLKWYLDGVLVQTDVGTGTAGPCIARFGLQDLPTSSLVVGGRMDRGLLVDGCDGAIKSASIFSRALSAAEIATVYASGPFGLRV